MNLNPADDEILSFQVIGGTGGLTKRESVRQGDLMRLDEVSNEILGRCRLDRQFLDSGSLCESFQSTVRQDVQSTNTFSEFIDRLEKLLVLFLKSRMKLKEIRTFNIPVRQV